MRIVECVLLLCLSIQSCRCFHFVHKSRLSFAQQQADENVDDDEGRKSISILVRSAEFTNFCLFAHSNINKHF